MANFAIPFALGNPGIALIAADHALSYAYGGYYAATKILVGLGVTVGLPLTAGFLLSGSPAQQKKKHHQALAEIKRIMPVQYPDKGTMANMSYGSGMPGISNPQFVTSIRGSKSRYGKKRRKNLRNAWYELNKENNWRLTRWQTFADQGFTNGLGPIPCSTWTPFLSDSKHLPCYAFRLTSTVGELKQPSNDTVNIVDPIVPYRLTFDTVPNAYGWLPMNENYIQNYNPGGLVRRWNNDVIEDSGVAPNGALIGFRHMWSRARMTFYAQTNTPTVWTIRLVKFRADLASAGPASQARRSSDNVTINVYPDGIQGVQKEATITDMYDHLFSGGSTHPNMKQRRRNDDGEGYQPYSVLKTEKVFVPAREVTDGTAGVRISHDLFFRNDRHYKTNASYDNVDQGNTVGSYDYYDTADTMTACPMVKPEDEVWLMITNECYTQEFATVDDSFQQASTNVPTFDMVLENKWQWNATDTIRPRTINNPPAEGAALLETTDPTPEVTKETTEPTEATV